MQIGTDMAFTGETPKGEYSSFDAVNLSSHPIGAQSLYGKLFLLSVEELTVRERKKCRSALVSLTVS